MDTDPPRTWTCATALMLTAALIMGIPALLLGMEFEIPPSLVAMIGAGTGLIAAAVVLGAGWLTRSWPVHEYARWLGAGLIVGAACSFVLLADAGAGAGAGAGGLIVALPVAAAVVTAGYALDGPLRRNPPLARLLIIIGAVFILTMALATLAL